MSEFNLFEITALAASGMLVANLPYGERMGWMS
jgi:23S rRNA G2445 N2-methylase RlmL